MPTENEARQALQRLLDDYHRLTREDLAQMTEASVVRQFIDRLLRDVLGWPIEDPARYKYELATQAGRPDITLIPDSGGTIFVEAKRFGAIKELREARRTIAGVITPGELALPGMAVDRTEEEQQAINYAFANGGTWAILTNFEKLRLFNARRDWLVLSFETPAAYLDEFEQLWPLAYHNILKGSLDRLSNQRYTRDVDTQYLDFINEWREKLAQDIVQRQEHNPWVLRDDGSIDLPTLRAVVQRFLDRLVIVRFAEDHLVITPGTLRQYYDLCLSNPYTFTMDEFLDRFFRRFDTDHNSALFAEGLVDHASFSDEVLLPLIGKLYEARYRSMPADIIGNTYEQYLGKALALDNGSVTTRDNLETRKKQGSYYTPQVIVRHLVDTTLGRYLHGTANGLPDGEPVEGERRKTSRDIRDLRVLDSACGSGSFLIYAYYVLADFYESEIRRLQAEMEARNQELAAQGVSPMERRLELADYTVELERIRDYPRLILETHLYGVDLDPQAAEIAVVNLIMRAMERRQHEKRLPQILNQNVKVGNSLVGLRPDDPR
ncbi:MAG: N-6 DNA methylase, partial [Chloroflexota bacterium]